MLATMSEPPPRGSLQESVLQVLLVRLDQVDYAKTRALVTAIINASKEGIDETQKELDAYRDLQFPYYKNIQKTERSDHIKRLQQEVARGPLVVTAMPEKRMKSKLKTRVVERMTPEQRATSRRLSKKLGRLM
jgi:hypothetical protein